MNRKFVLYLLGTKMQDFMYSAMNFGFLMIFYDLTDSVVGSGVLTAAGIVGSRAIMFFLIPLLKPYSPMKVSAGMSLVMAVTASAASWVYSFEARQIVFYLSFSVIFSMIQEMSRSFTQSVLPRIVEKAYLFKANSINGIFFNVSAITAPMFSYLFTFTNMGLIFPIYLVVSLCSAWIMFTLYLLGKDEIDLPPAAVTVAKLSFFSQEWIKTLRLIGSSPSILFCIAIGVSINMIFAGINGPFLLKMGGDPLGSTLIKISLSVGSLLGVYGAFILKVKEKYDQYLKYSVIGIVTTLLLLIVNHNSYFLLFGMMALTIFVMFIMNTTGTFLQLITPIQEIPAVYELRSTLYAVVVPISYVGIGWLLEHWSYRVYFALSIVIIVLTWRVKGKKKIHQQQSEDFGGSVH